ncbi:unnamed protein product [Danaus chrysippus]|uniref:(African queen) hypothetical protein n=1 Tax=Danaus chrysippus TaxID=151541 RepID=A0A8J2QYE2_9NEOP|nr:unnamed protein product [Danaus chrysippus]
MQNEQMRSLIHALNVPGPRNNVTLPEFDPESLGHSSRSFFLSLQKPIRSRTKRERRKGQEDKDDSEKKKSSTSNRPTLMVTSTGSEIIRCPLCLEVHIEPPNEDWIQCSICEAWWHHECNDYLGFGVFKCDNC